MFERELCSPKLIGAWYVTNQTSLIVVHVVILELITTPYERWVSYCLSFGNWLELIEPKDTDS